ncbi:hypothetical protein TRFO_13463 [Tritrichomonas foetus]|uniref:Uncharacterized protein n=1 Tax=Tritrichomonas foetus TaxID=1144522 RepID=A0A1J4L2G3_9EUKA|nr:hypothetical protein TRFO_13463 [Tritrichomonas foetus]|eukprot:OHT16134.1 hypothetical protein TRFO_13463 [Tritrichomonas foetus]
MNDSCAQLNSEQPKTIQNPDKNKTRNSLIPNHSNKLNVQNIQSLENKNRDETMKREVNNTSLHKIKNYVPRCSIATPPPVYVF